VRIARLSVLSLLLLACGGHVPAVVRDEIARAPKGVATIVFFTDFQCPFCKRTHAALAPLLEGRRGRVRVVYKHVPLPSHPDALAAARAAICGERITGTTALADALMASLDLGDEAIETLAAARGVDRETLRRCVSEPAVDARLEADLAAFDAVDGDGVPLLYVGTRRLDGAQPRRVLAAALDDALAAAR
jgi:predicted DsbA family dithiol-disulfide isomerase